MLEDGRVRSEGCICEPCLDISKLGEIVGLIINGDRDA